jgi:leucyl-tRNA synthetase
VIPEGAEPEDFAIGEEAYTGPGRLANSAFLDGLEVEAAKNEAAARIESAGAGSRTVNYRLRDWLVSRQRYWGCPIPIIHCNACGMVPVAAKDLPVRLPDDVGFDKPGNPLDHHPSWKHAECPKCGAKARRMKRAGVVSLDEPFSGLFTQGMVCHETFKDEAGNWLEPDEVEKRDGCYVCKGTDINVRVGPSEKMSKSKKNVIAPETIIDAFGADTIRWFMLSDTPPERDIEWTQEGAEGCWRFVQRVYRLVAEAENLPSSDAPSCSDDSSLTLRQATHRAIDWVTEDLEHLRFNRAVARIYELTNAISAAAKSSPARREALETLVLLCAPMMPHLAETCWNALGNKTLVVETPWPKADPELVKRETLTIAVQVNGKRRGEVEIPADAPEEVVRELALSLVPVQRALDGKAPRRVIVVPGRIVNIVA